MYIPSDETMLQLGLYDYVWGDNTMLQNYLSRLSQEEQRQFQAEENAKNRQSQREYNEYLKEYDNKQQQNAAKLEIAKLRKELVNADPISAAVIEKQIEQIAKENGLSIDTQLNEINEATEQAAEVANRKIAIMAEYKQQLDEAKTLEEKKNILNKIETEREVQGVTSDFNEKAHALTLEDVNKLYEYAFNKLTLQDAKQASVNSALASHAGKKTADKLSEQEAKKKLADSGRKKIREGRPERVTIKEQTAIDEGY